MKAVELIMKLREAGRKVTPQRLAVFRALEGDRTHPTAEELYRRLIRRHPTLTRATVYQTLRLLRDQGAVQELGSAGGPRHYDPNTAPHAHSVCRRCGAVADVEPPLGPGPPLPRRIHDFEVEACQTVFYGTCGSCRSQDIRSPLQERLRAGCNQ